MRLEFAFAVAEDSGSVHQQRVSVCFFAVAVAKKKLIDSFPHCLCLIDHKLKL